MRRIITILLATILFSSPAYAGWVDDWVQQKTVTGPSSFEGQQRGYLSGGSVSLRWQNKNEYPISIEKPYFRFGCGGIDAFMGSFSMLNPDYLVARFQRMIQNAPALSFNIALDTLASQVSKQLNWLNSQIDMLNSIQLSDCAMAKKAVTYIKEPSKISENYEKATAAAGNWVETARSDLFDKAKTNVADSSGQQIVSDTGAGGALSGCPADIQDVFLQPNTTILQNIVNKLGYPSVYADMMRGYVGDYYIFNNNGSLQYAPIGNCPEQEGEKNMIDAFLTGEVMARPTNGGSCYQIADANKNFNSFVKTNLDGILNSIKNRSSLNAASKTFINMSEELPVMEYIKYAILTGNEDYVERELSVKLAKFFAAVSLYDLHTRIIKTYKTVYNIKDNYSAKKGCDLTVLGNTIDKTKKLAEQAEKNRNKLEDAMGKIKEEITAGKIELDRDYQARKDFVFTKAGFHGLKPLLKEEK